MTNPSGKREDICRTALELFAEHGFHGTSMAMIADNAGVGAGTIYRYFENKDVLIKVLYKSIEGQIVEVVRKDCPPGGPVRTRFIHITRVLLNYCISHPREFRYIEQYHNSPYGVSFRRDKLLGKSADHDIIHELFKEGTAQGVIKDLPLTIFFAIALGPLIAVARDHILGFIVLDDALITQTVEACWDGVEK